MQMITPFVKSKFNITLQCSDIELTALNRKFVALFLTDDSYC
jgi:hypothetical protein